MTNSNVPTAISDLFFSYAPGLQGDSEDNPLYENGEGTDLLREAANMFITSMRSIIDIDMVIDEDDLVSDFMNRL